MRLSQRLRIVAPRAVRPDVWTLIAAAVSTAAVGHIGDLTPLLAIPAVKLLVLIRELADLERLRNLEAGAHRKRFFRRLREFRRARRRIRLPKDDTAVLERIEVLLESIYRQYEVADPTVQASLRQICDTALDRALGAVTPALKLSALVDYLARENPMLVENEAQRARVRMEMTRDGDPLRELYAYLHRSKQQQADCYQTAIRNAAVYRAQISAIEAGLANVRGRMAGLAALDFGDLSTELELMDAELSVLAQGIERTAGLLRDQPGFSPNSQARQPHRTPN